MRVYNELVMSPYSSPSLSSHILSSQFKCSNWKKSHRKLRLVIEGKKTLFLLSGFNPIKIKLFLTRASSGCLSNILSMWWRCFSDCWQVGLVIIFLSFHSVCGSILGSPQHANHIFTVTYCTRSACQTDETDLLGLWVWLDWVAGG